MIVRKHPVISHSWSHTWGSYGLWGPVLGVLVLAKPFIVVTLGGKELLEVRLAVEYSLHGGVVAESEVTLAV